MYTPLEHDYLGSGGSSSSSSSATSPPGDGPDMGAARLTLRLGLPRSESPERAGSGEIGLTLDLLPKSGGFGSGAKRGFADAIDGSDKWAAESGAVVGPGKEVVGGGGALGKVVAVEKETKGKAAADSGAGGGSGSGAPRAAKAQVVGWPPIRNYRKTTLASSISKNKGEDEGKSEAGCLYVKVSMDGAPYLRKVDLKTYSSYEDLSLALEKMFSCFISGQSSSHELLSKERLTESRRADALQDQEYVLTYEDKDKDWMLVGDLPWKLFTDTCRKLRIMKGSDAAGIAAPRPLEQTGQNKQQF